MKIHESDPTFDNYKIFLDGKQVLLAVSADEEEGWVDIVDLAAMAPLDLDEDSPCDWEEEAKELESSEPADFLTKRLRGTVKIVKA